MTETLEIRSAQVADVDFPRRTVTVIAMPYEQPTKIHDSHRSYTEVVSRGAFDGIEQRTSQIKVNRDHNWDKAVGRIVAIHPSRTEGLVTEIRMSRSRPGEDALLDCADKILDASAGFGLLRQNGGSGPVHPDAEVWETRSLRRLNKLWLDHVALVPNPAYSGATVIDVRDDPGRPQEPAGRDGTPNRDWITNQELRAQNDALNERWSRRRVTLDVRILPGE